MEMKKETNILNPGEYVPVLEYIREKLGLASLDDSYGSEQVAYLVRQCLNSEVPEQNMLKIAQKNGINVFEGKAGPKEISSKLRKLGFVIIYNYSDNPYHGWIAISATGNYAGYEITSFTTHKVSKVNKYTLGKILGKKAMSYLCFENYNLLKESKHQSPLRRLISMFKDDKRDIFVVLIYSVVIGIFSLVIPVSVQSLVNTLAFGVLLQPLIILTLIVMLSLGFSSLMRIMRYYIVEILQQRIFAKISLTFSYRLSLIKHNAYKQVYIPELVNRFFDVVTVQKSASVLLVDGLGIALQTVIGLLLVSFYHPLLLAFDFVLIVAILFVLFILGSGAVSTSIDESKVKYEAAAWLEEIARNNTSFRDYASFLFAADKTNRIIKKYIKYRRKHFKILLRQIIGNFVIYVFSISALLGLGGWLVIKGELTLGQLVASEIIIASIVSSLIKFGKHLEVYYDLMAAIDKLGYLIDLPVEDENNFHKNCLGDEQKIELKVNALSYKRNNLTQLKTVSFELKQGDLIAITGDDGAGKSTLADILYGLKEFEQGIIEFNGQDIRSLQLRSLRKKIALGRNIEFFDGTVEENIRTGNYSISNQELMNILKELGLYEQILVLPEGLQTYIHPAQDIFSDEQAYLLMLSRLLVRQPKILIIDEIFDKMEVERARTIIRYISGLGIGMLILTRDRMISRICNHSLYLTQGELRKEIDVHASEE